MAWHCSVTGHSQPILGCGKRSVPQHNDRIWRNSRYRSRGTNAATTMQSNSTPPIRLSALPRPIPSPPGQDLHGRQLPRSDAERFRNRHPDRARPMEKPRHRWLDVGRSELVHAGRASLARSRSPRRRGAGSKSSSPAPRRSISTPWWPPSPALGTCRKIVATELDFPSDIYAIQSQIRCTAAIPS